MRRSTLMARTAVSLMILLAACSDRSGVQSRTHPPSASPDGSAFALVQTGGPAAMGVDQHTSTHRFEALPDGGRITLVRDGDDAAGVTQIRAHMAEIAVAFRRGDFTIPGFVHDRAVPGTATMAAHRSRISYIADTLPHGGSLRIYSTDSTAIPAIHQFLAFQRQDHRSPHANTTQ
jgi:hypothetical protein